MFLVRRGLKIQKNATKKKRVRTKRIKKLQVRKQEDSMTYKTWRRLKFRGEWGIYPSNKNDSIFHERWQVWDRTGPGLRERFIREKLAGQEFVVVQV